MAIHRVETVDPNFFEVGVVPDEMHYLRINTIKNGVIAEISFLEINKDHRIWNLEVDNAIASGVSKYTAGRPGDINRLQHPYERDYRWITELGELFGDLRDKTDTKVLFPVLRIHEGLFSTRVKSDELSILIDGTSEEFGSIATVVACDIPIMAGTSVRLVEEGTGKILFTFQPDENTIYEFANTPAEVPKQAAVHPEPGGTHDGDTTHHGGGGGAGPAPAAVPDPCQNEHFKSYYKLFTGPQPSICFTKTDPPPAPDPATCGAVGTGDLKGPFGD
jgi:hypothetical protein